MPSMFPTPGAIFQAFSRTTPFEHTQSPTPYQAREDLYSNWSVADDAKAKARQLTDDARFKAHELSDEARLKAHELSEEAKSRAHQLGDKASREFEGARLKANEMTEEARLRAHQFGDKASKEFDKAGREFEKASNTVQAKTGKIDLYSGKYYAACTLGGVLACGLTHTAVTPLDLVKCRRQVDSKMYKGNFEAWGKISRAEGLRGVFTGWGPTFFGYSVQGGLKYGGYEFFKKTYADLVGDEAAHRYRTWLYLGASASAEFIADIGLCPFEAVKVRMQTTIPPFATGTFSGINTITAAEGTAGLYKGLYPLWARQIPYTMMKFASFETIVEMIYARMAKPKSEYSKATQTGVSFVGGYLAGILCAIVSHPADVMVSKLNATRKPGEAFGSATSRIYSDIGFRGLWNGLPIRIVMIGTLTGLQWMIYDYFKIFMGFPTTGGAAPVSNTAVAKEAVTSAYEDLKKKL